MGVRTCLVTLMLVGCAPFVGSATPMRVRVDEPGGVRVLYDVSAPGPEGDLVAGSQSELDAIVAARSLPPVQPPVDFTTHVVLGATRWTPGDRPAIVGLAIDGGARIRPLHRAVWFEYAELLRLVISRRTTLLAIPRRMLPAPGEEVLLQLDSRDVRARVPALPTAAQATSAPRRSPPTESRGVVTLPARGHLALRTLDDGSDVWVVHREDGSVAVLAADVVVEEQESSVHGVSFAIEWEDFWRGFIPLGHDVAGEAPGAAIEPVEVHAFERVEGDRLRVGERLPGTPQLASAPVPFIEGASSRPYRDRVAVPIERLADAPAGSFQRVEAAIRIDARGARLCPLPAEPRVARACGTPSYPVLDVSANASSLAAGHIAWIRVIAVRWRDGVVDHPIARWGGSIDWVHAP